MKMMSVQLDIESVGRYNWMKRISVSTIWIKVLSVSTIWMKIMSVSTIWRKMVSVTTLDEDGIG